MASTPEQVVCTPTFVFPAAFPDVLTLCNSSAPWTEYRGFDPRPHIANFHAAAAASAQSQPLQHPEDTAKSKAANRGGNIKNHPPNPNNDFVAARNLLAAAASAPPAFPGIDGGIKVPAPNMEKQQQQQQQQHHQQHEEEDKDRLWPCPSCKVPFKAASELQAHLSAHTKGEKTVPCEICGKMFASGERVRIHIRAAHGEKSCACDICGSGFSYRCKLLDHMRTHTGDKPFHCDVCGKSFSQKNHLTRHSMIHTGERPYPCDFCGRGFYRKDKLTRHRRIHTGERVTGHPRRRGGHFNSKMSPGTNRHNRGMGHHSNPATPNNNAPNNAPTNTPNNNIKMEPLPEANPSTTTSTSLSFAPATLTPSISPSHFRASPYKTDWQGAPSGVH